MQRVTPFLWYDNNAEEAVNDYLSIFKNRRSRASRVMAAPGPVRRELKDKYGLSWQIVPSVWLELLQDKDGERSKRVMQAMLQMRKIDIGALQRAYDGTQDGTENSGGKLK